MKKLTKIVRLLNKFTILKKRKYKALKKAKQLYLKGFSKGMCCSLEAALYNEKFHFIDIQEIIPEFNPTFLNADKTTNFWWDIEDTESRIKAFDLLIKLYE